MLYAVKKKRNISHLNVTKSLLYMVFVMLGISYYTTWVGSMTIWIKTSYIFCLRDQGVKINNLDVTCGDIIVNLNENLFVKTKKEQDPSTCDDGNEGANLDFISAKKSQKNKFSPLSIKKHIFLFPEKVCEFPEIVLFSSVVMLAVSASIIHCILYILHKVFEFFFVLVMILCYK